MWHPFNHSRLFLLALVMMTCVAYLPALNGTFVWDDDDHVVENQNLRSLKGLFRTWFDPLSLPQYYPLVHTSFWVEYQLWGLNPLGYHLVNVVLHALGAWLLWHLLVRLEVPGAWLAAALFALHPVNVESVAWITERKNVLSGVLYIASALAFVRYFRLEKSTSDNDVQTAAEGSFSNSGAYLLGAALFAFALLSKTVTSTLPAALVLILWWKKGRIRFRDVIAVVPLLILGLVFGIVTAWLEFTHVQAQGPEWQLSLMDRCLVAGRAIWFYASKLVWPVDLMFNYPRWQIDSRIWWQYLYPFSALIVVVLIGSYHKRLGRGPVTAILLYCGTLFPALGFINVYPFRYSFVADHFAYHAIIALVALAAASIWRVRDSWIRAQSAACVRYVGVSVLLVLLVLLGSQTWKQSRIYRNMETLWRDTIHKNPESWMAQTNLGCELSRQGRASEAMHHYEESLRIRPDDPTALTGLGHKYAELGRLEEALALHLKALQADPNCSAAHNNLAYVLERQGKYRGAMAHYHRAVEIDPRFAAAHNNLGILYSDMGRFEEAIPYHQQAIQLRPDYVAAYNSLGITLARQGNLAEAARFFDKAIGLKPDYADAYFNLGLVFARQNKLGQAKNHFRKAIRLSPNHVAAHQSLSKAYWITGDRHAALEEYEIVKRLDREAAAELDAFFDRANPQPRQKAGGK